MTLRHIKPMLATLVEKPFNASGWLFEIKWDGFRTVANLDRRAVEIYSRNFLSFNDRFQPIVEALKKLNIKAILDGEVVVVDSTGKSGFQLLQNFQNTGEGHLVYYIFDILSLNGKDLKTLPLLERKKILKKTLKQNYHLKYSDHVLEKGIKFFQAAKKQGLEGIMAKEGQSPYRPGERTDEWQKIKLRHEQEAVIGGFTEPRGSRKKLGALVLGVYQRGKFVYIGHTGGGFNETTLNLVYNKLQPLKQKESPFVKAPKTNAPVTWVKPKLVCEVTFEEWTEEGHMRQPIFLGLRSDKKASEVRREIPKSL